jgi:ribonuclease BN (tRNA processing enzyme)
MQNLAAPCIVAFRYSYVVQRSSQYFSQGFFSQTKGILRIMKWGLRVDFRFHGVGQGLFSSGRIATLSPTEGSQFNWVYDCGTSSRQHYLDSALGDLECDIYTPAGQRPYLDLVTVSHFDTDHISGLVKLLERFDIGDLLLPYMPLWQRLVIAFHAHRGHRSRLTSFLVNPVAFIAAVPESNVKRILFASSGPPLEEPRLDADISPDPGRPTAPGDERAEPRRGKTISVEVDIEELSSLGAADDRSLDASRMASEAKKGTGVAFMNIGTALVVAGCWEFMPYNDAQLAPMASAGFRNKVSHLRSDLLGGVKSVAISALETLKTLYSTEFDFSSHEENNNLISLFLHAGPTDPSADVIRVRFSSGDRWSCHHRIALTAPGKGSLLYTGDGYLDTEARFASMQSFLGAHRLERLAALQVMHHGARANWHTGLAGKLRPEFSVFSSNPLHKRYRHPHTEVLEDFAPYRPLQASKGSAVNLVFGLLLPR